MDLLSWDSFYAAATNLATGLAGAGLAYLTLRKRFAADSTDIVGHKIEANLLATLIRERDAANARSDALDKMVHEAWAMRTEDARSIARLETRVEAFLQRSAELQDEREKKFGACEERVRSLAERVLDLQMANGRLFADLARADKDAADRLLVAHLRPGPPGPGDEPP